MGYQESWLYIEPQHKFKKLIQAYERRSSPATMRWPVRNLIPLLF